MDFLKVDYSSKESTLASFDKIANKFSRHIKFKVNDAYYRIVDFEFYIYSDTISDPHTYKHDLQRQPNKLYLHASGVDITFGDGKNHGGILLRSVVKLYDGADKSTDFMKKQFDGPQKVATELFSNLNSLNGLGINEIRLIDMEEDDNGKQFLPGEFIIQTSRVGLKPKKTDLMNHYLTLNLRYIILVQKFPKFKQKVKGIESILRSVVAKGQINADEATTILGYTFK